jgi:nucleoside-diphosphate-sugar epimerase
MRILVTGSSGFLGGYIVNELLGREHEVMGIDNFSKYGEVAKQHDGHPRYTLVRGRLQGHFHAYGYDLLAENERISRHNI